MGSLISILSEQPIGLCIITPVVIITILVLIFKLFSFTILPKDVKLPVATRKVDFLTILKDVAKARAGNENSKVQIP